MTDAFRKRPPAEMIRHHVTIKIIDHNRAHPENRIPDVVFDILRNGIRAAYEHHEKEIANAD